MDTKTRILRSDVPKVELESVTYTAVEHSSSMAIR